MSDFEDGEDPDSYSRAVDDERVRSICTSQASSSSSSLTNTTKKPRLRQTQLTTCARTGLTKVDTITTLSVVRPNTERLKRSAIWRFVTKADRTSHECTICHQIILADGNTSNTRKHLLKHHPVEWKEATTNQDQNDELVNAESGSESDSAAVDTSVDDPTPEIGTVGGTTTGKRQMKRKGKIILLSQRTYGPKDPKKIKLDRSLGHMIAEDFEPYAIVDRKGMSRHSLELNPRYKMPDRNKLAKSIVPQLYSDVQELLVNRLREARFVCITFDGWTSNANDSFLTVTGHYLPDKEYEIESVTLGLIASKFEHSGENYATEIRRTIIEKFKFYEHGVSIVCATTDNAANMLKTAAELSVKHMPCFVHTLQLVVNDVLFPKMKIDEKPNDEFNVEDLLDEPDELPLVDDSILPSVSSIIKKGKLIAGFFHRSSKATALLQAECKARGVRYYRLIQCVVTRWNSLYFMLRRIRDCHQSINFVLVTAKSNIPILSEDDLRLMNDVLACLKPFADTTAEFSGEKYMTASLIIPNVTILLTQLESLTPTLQTGAGMELSRNLRERSEVRLGRYESRTIPMLATILDPRFKSSGFRDMKNYRNATELLKNEVTERIRRTHQSTPVATSDEPVICGNSKYSQLTRTHVPILQNSNNNVASAVVQVNGYLTLPTEPFEKLANPIVYWQTKHDNYTDLREIALKYLIVPASSVSAERAASAAGNTILKKRSCLSTDHAEQLVFLQKNSFLLDL